MRNSAVRIMDSLYRFPLVRIGACIILVLFNAWGCNQTHSESSSSPPPIANGPRDGIGQRLGKDVTAQPSLNRAEPIEEVPKILAFGDSLTAGAGIASGESYPAQLQKRLDKNGYRYRVVNAGVSGDTTAGAVRRIDWALKGHPEIVILELGGNDGLRGLSLDQMQSNLDLLVRRARSTGASVILAGMKLPLNYGDAYRSQFEAVYEQVARVHRVSWMPFFLEGVGAQAALNQADGIHPTAEGYRVVVENLWPVLEPLLKKAPEHRSMGDAAAINPGG